MLWMIALLGCSSGPNAWNLDVRGTREGRFAELDFVSCLIGLDDTGRMTWNVEFYVHQRDDLLVGFQFDWRELPANELERHVVRNLTLETFTNDGSVSGDLPPLFGVRFPGHLVYSFGSTYPGPGDSAGVTTRAVVLHELRIPPVEISSQFTTETIQIEGYLTDTVIYCIDAQAVTQ